MIGFLGRESFLCPYTNLGNITIFILNKKKNINEQKHNQIFLPAT